MNKPRVPGLCHTLQHNPAFSIHTIETSKASHPFLTPNCPQVHSRNLECHLPFKPSSPSPPPAICLNLVLSPIRLTLLLSYLSHHFHHHCCYLGSGCYQSCLGSYWNSSWISRLISFQPTVPRTERVSFLKLKTLAGFCRFYAGHLRKAYQWLPISYRIESKLHPVWPTAFLDLVANPPRNKL